MSKKAKLTKWFPPSVLPARIGVYEADWPQDVGTSKERWFAYWDGFCWGFMRLDKKSAVAVYKDRPGDRHRAGSLSWRGLDLKP